MKNSIVPFFAFICLTSMLHAQTSEKNADSKFTLGIFGGLNIPRLTDDSNNELSRGFSSRLGLAFGLTTSYSLSANFALRADALYSSEGGKRDGLQAIDATSLYSLAPAGSYYYANFNDESILTYLEVPVMLKYVIPVCKSSKFYIDFGPYFGYLLKAKQKTSGSSMVYIDRAETTPLGPGEQSFDANNDVTSNIKRFNFGITGGIGFTEEIGFGELFLDVRGAYGLTNVQKYSKDGKSHNGYVLIALGYSIGL